MERKDVIQMLVCTARAELFSGWKAELEEMIYSVDNLTRDGGGYITPEESCAVEMALRDTFEGMEAGLWELLGAWYRGEEIGPVTPGDGRESMFECRVELSRRQEEIHPQEETDD